MIKNIIFDMGNVLTAYREDAVAHHFIEDEAERKEVTEQVFKSKEWLLLSLIHIWKNKRSIGRTLFLKKNKELDQGPKIA